ncbi:MAG: Holliday junction branch migration protein RuvA [Planctomycetes bacterium]|nr:Holliday junction branch migration protein RuvA [Planctomycetota bacterium]
MYDHLLGEIVEKHASRAVVRCAGVGYDVRVSLNSASDLVVGQTQKLFTILNVVDGTPSLLGFSTPAERELARRLLAVTNVGPAIALALLSVYTPRDLAARIAADDAPALKAVKGVGQKTAERICLELREVVTKLDLGAAAPGEATDPAPASIADDDAIAALVTLGFKESDARAKVDKARKKQGATADTEAIVKAVLQM